MERNIQIALQRCQKTNNVQERKDILNRLFAADGGGDNDNQIIKYLLIDLVSKYNQTQHETEKAVKLSPQPPNPNSKLGTIPFMANVSIFYPLLYFLHLLSTKIAHLHYHTNHFVS